ncbi:hypothetical protein TNCV_3252191 [Trichonephila clavipes]|nr:hypothetical protein TNCV_3252191 [Trichonephila clavipes]
MPSPPSGPSKPVLRMSFPDESIRNVGKPDSRKPFSPTSSEHSPQYLSTRKFSREISGRGREMGVPSGCSP